MTPATWAEFGLHQTIPVIYLNDDPANSRPDLPVETQLLQKDQEVAIICGALFLVIGLIVIFAKKRSVTHIS